MISYHLWHRVLPGIGAPWSIIDPARAVPYAIAATSLDATLGVPQEAAENVRRLSIRCSRVEDLLRTHFGVFGFTGAGKSNLVSTLVSDILSQSRETVKILCFDLMGEYTALLADHLVQAPDAMILALGEQTLPGPVLDYLVSPDEAGIREPVGAMLRTTLFPRALVPRRSDFAYPLRDLIRLGRIRVYRERVPTVDSLVEQHRGELTKKNPGTCLQALVQLGQRLQTTYAGQAVAQQTIAAVLGDIDAAAIPNITATGTNNLQDFRSRLRDEGQRYADMRPLPPVDCRSNENVHNRACHNLWVYNFEVKQYRTAVGEGHLIDHLKSRLNGTRYAKALAQILARNDRRGGSQRHGLLQRNRPAPTMRRPSSILAVPSPR